MSEFRPSEFRISLIHTLELDCTSSIRATFHLTLATLVESFHPCYLSNVKQRQMMLASVASVKWNAASVRTVDPSSCHLWNV